MLSKAHRIANPAEPGTTLLMLSKIYSTCRAIIYTKKVNLQLQLDLEKHNEQYPNIKIKTLTTAYDRFLILDEKEIFHIGASLKDLGKKWFAFSKLNEFLFWGFGEIRVNSFLFGNAMKK